MEKIAIYFLAPLLIFAMAAHISQAAVSTDVRSWLMRPETWNVPEDLKPLLEDLRISTVVGEQITRPWEEYLEEKPFRVFMAQTPDSELVRLRGILDAALEKIDLQALQRSDWPRFRASLEKARTALRPLGDFARTYTVFILGNSHIDMAWLWRWYETVEVCRNTFAQQLELMRLYPDFIYAQSSAQAYRWMEERYPDLFAEIRRRVQEGRWEVVGGMVVEPDCNLIGGESWVRQILYGKRYFRQKLGADVWLGWNPDSFGYNWNMPQFFLKSGIKAFITQKISWNDTNEFPYHLFWWEGADGSRVLTYFPYTGYIGRLTIDEIVTSMRQNEANTGRKEVLMLFGFGDHGGGPEKKMLERYLKYQHVTVFPRLQFIRGHDFIRRLLDSDLSDLPVWKDELYLEYHRGTYTTHAAIKKSNRQAEILLASAEKLASLAAQFGAPYPQKTLKEAWWKLLFNQFHDILPGSGIAPIYRDALEDYRKVFRSGTQAVSRSLAALGQQIRLQPRSGFRPLLVFNSLSWERNGLVFLPVADAGSHWLVQDESGNALPSQILADEEGTYLVFPAVRMPSLGYRVYWLKPTGAAHRQNSTPQRTVLENRYFRLRVDSSSGNVVSLFDKSANREVLDGSGEGNLIHLFEDRPKNWDAWNIGYTGKAWKLDRADTVELLDDGPVFTRLRVRKSFLGPSKARRFPTEKFPSSFFVQDIVLYKTLPLVEVRMQVDWWEDHILAKVEWPVAVQADSATYEIPYAAIRRPTTERNSWEKARFEVPALRWIDLSGKNYGVSVITDSKYGYDIHGNRMRITLLRSPKSPDPTADRGKHFIRYAIFPHRGDWRRAGTVRMARNFTTPLFTQWIGGGNGKLPPEKAFLHVKPSGVVLAALKPAEDGNGWILRFYESEGKPAEVNVRLWRKIRSAVEVDLMEREIGPVSFEKDRVRFPVKRFETKTLRVSF